MARVKNTAAQMVKGITPTEVAYLLALIAVILCLIPTPAERAANTPPTAPQTSPSRAR